MSQAPAGWYTQPDGQQRYWDGEKWTEHFAPTAAPTTPPPPPAGAGSGFAAGPQRNWFMRHKILTGLAGVVAIALIGSLGTSGGDHSTAAAAGRSAQSSTESGHSKARAAKAAPVAAKKQEKAAGGAKKLPGLGDKARDGKFEFVIKGIHCGRQSVGSSFMAEKAQGQFCLVKMTVKNIGDEAQMLDGSNQYAFDAKGHKFENDTSAELTLEENKTFLEGINPGNSIAGTVIFDVPPRTKITKLELHDSAFSDGVDVAVK